jgi:hypothetical protein
MEGPPGDAQPPRCLSHVGVNVRGPTAFRYVYETAVAALKAAERG